MEKREDIGPGTGGLYCEYEGGGGWGVREGTR